MISLGLSTHNPRPHSTPTSPEERTVPATSHPRSALQLQPPPPVASHSRHAPFRSPCPLRAAQAPTAFSASSAASPQPQSQAPAKGKGYVRRVDKGPRPPSKKYPSRAQKQKVFYTVELLPFDKLETLEVHEIAKRAGAGKGKREARACPLCGRSFETEHRLKDHLESPVHGESAVWGGGGGKKKKGRGGGGGGGGA